MKNIKKPEIIVITAMDETGLIGNGNTMPWRSSVDFNHFKKQTTSWPCIFGKNTALGMMPNFPLKNRPCAIVSNKMETQILPASFQSGAHLAFGPGPFYDALGEALRFFKNYDKVFIAGGAALYQSAMHGKRSALWETGDHEIPLVDTIIKTVFPAGHATGDKFIDADTLKLMGAPHFELIDSLEYKLIKPNSSNTDPNYFGEYFLDKVDGEEIDFQTSGTSGHLIPAKKTDTLFPWIRFETWRRAKENPGK